MRLRILFRELKWRSEQNMHNGKKQKLNFGNVIFEMFLKLKNIHAGQAAVGYTGVDFMVFKAIRFAS